VQAQQRHLRIVLAAVLALAATTFVGVATSAGAGAVEEAGIELAEATRRVGSAAASDTTRYSQIKLSIWPEYDDPRVLVIMEPVLASTVTLPATVSFLLPRGARVNMACEVTEGGGHNCRPLRTERKGKFDKVSYLVTSRRTLFFEYYYDARLSGPDKRFTFDYVPTYAADRLAVEVQRPLKARAFSVSPPAKDVFTDNQGFRYFRYEIDGIRPGRRLSWTVGYTKPEPQPSVTKNVEDSPAALPPAPSAGPVASNAPALALGVMALALIGGVILFWRLVGSGESDAGREGVGDSVPSSEASPGSPGGASPGGASPGGASPGAGRSGASGSSGFSCPGCGARMNGYDNYCVACGRERTVLCARCGTECRRGSQFCASCGAELAICEK